MDGGSECTRPGQGWRRKSRRRTRCRSRCRCRRRCRGRSWRTRRGRLWRRSCPWRTASARWSRWWRNGPARRGCTRSRRSRPGRSPRRTAGRPRCACRWRSCPRRTPSARWRPGRRCSPDRRAYSARRPTGPSCPSRNRPCTAATFSFFLLRCGRRGSLRSRSPRHRSRHQTPLWAGAGAPEGVHAGGRWGPMARRDFFAIFFWRVSTCFHVLHTAVAWQTVNELACGESGIVHGAKCIAVLNGVA